MEAKKNIQDPEKEVTPAPCPSLAILDFRSISDLVCGPLDPARIMLLFLCNPNSKHTNPF